MEITKEILEKRAIRFALRMGWVYPEISNIRWFDTVDIMGKDFYVGYINVKHIDLLLREYDKKNLAFSHGENMGCFGIKVDGSLEFWAN